MTVSEALLIMRAYPPTFPRNESGQRRLEAFRTLLRLAELHLQGALGGGPDD